MSRALDLSMKAEMNQSHVPLGLLMIKKFSKLVLRYVHDNQPH